MKTQLLSTSFSSQRQRSNEGQGLVEYALLLTLVALVAAGTLLLVGPNVGDVFSRIVNLEGAGVEAEAASLPDGVIEVLVKDAQGNPIANAWVYAFDGDGNYIGDRGRNRTGSPYGRTNSEGIATFNNMPNDSYQFLAYSNRTYYWSNAIRYPQSNVATIQINSHAFTVQVVKQDRDEEADDEEGNGIRNVYVYAYTANEKYWTGVSGRTDKNGKTTVNLPDGTYRFRAYYHNRWYASETFTTPPTNQIVINTKEEKFKVQVVDGNNNGIKQVRVYAYTDAGAYTGIRGRTDGKGWSTLKLPAGKYRFAVYYQSRWIWSAVVNPDDVDSATISTGQKPFVVTVLDSGGSPAAGVRVYAYTANTWYIGVNGVTDRNGQISFDLASGEYKFRSDFNGRMFWSSIVNSENQSAISMSVGE